MEHQIVVLDFETTGLEALFGDEILQVSAIDGKGNILLNEYCKPIKNSEWFEAQSIHQISPGDVKNCLPFESYIDRLSDILMSADILVIYNAKFELSFLDKYRVKYKEETIFCMMEAFSEQYGDWNDYYGNYKWQTLATCCRYYKYNLLNAHDSLEDVKATLYCFNEYIKTNDVKQKKKEVAVEDGAMPF